MGAVKNHFWDEICALGADDEDRAEAEIAADLEGHTEHELREALAEAVKVLGKPRVNQIINDEVPL